MAALALSIGVAAGGCANVWGFEDLSLAPDAVADQTAGEAGPATDAADQPDTATDALVAREAATVDGGIDGADIGPIDAVAPKNDADASGASACASICSGCCDSTGTCQPKLSVSQCGPPGQACVTCSASTCVVLTTACCGPKTGQCGCGAIGACDKN